VIAVLGGLGAAVCFTISALSASASSRAIGAQPTLAWVMLTGLVVMLPPTVLLADPAQLTWAVTAASPDPSTDRSHPAPSASRSHPDPSASRGHPDRSASQGHPKPGDSQAHPAPRTSSRTVRAAVLALPVALLFGVSLYATGRIGIRASVLWALLPRRLFGSALLAAPLAARRKLRVTRRVLPLVAAAGAAEVLGGLSYVVGARHQLAIAAVLSAQFAALTAVAAFVLHGQRLTRWQLAGLAAIAIGVSLLSALGQ